MVQSTSKFFTILVYLLLFCIARLKLHTRSVSTLTITVSRGFGIGENNSQWNFEYGVTIRVSAEFEDMLLIRL